MLIAGRAHPDNIGETLSTLRFGERASMIRTSIRRTNEVKEVRTKIDTYQQQYRAILARLPKQATNDRHMLMLLMRQLEDEYLRLDMERKERAKQGGVYKISAKEFDKASVCYTNERERGRDV